VTIDLKPNMILRGPIFSEPVQVIVAIPMGDSVKLIGKGLRTGQVHPSNLQRWKSHLNKNHLTATRPGFALASKH
jgi:hypothetical protein